MSGWRDFLKVYWPLIAVAAVGLIAAMMLMDPAPPKKIRFAAGSPGGHHRETPPYRAQHGNRPEGSQR